MSDHQEPRIELIPRRAAVCSDGPITLDVLVRITPPKPEAAGTRARPPLNLALVLDRSGSMAAMKKMPFAVEAASFAVQQLLPTDRVSVTTFDDRVETVVPSTLAEDKPAILRRIATAQPRGCTDLHGGWEDGAKQALEHRRPDGLNRVLLLSDGLANHGVTDPNAIAAAVKTLAAKGVGTTAMGLGDDYNEDLLEAMAAAGDGNYYYIESPAQLADLFQSELKGLMATIGQKASLGLESGEGVGVSDVLNDFDRLPTGRSKLPNLVVGMPVLALVRLTVPARPSAAPALVLSTRVAWDPPRGGPRRSLYARLDLPSVPLAAWSALPEDASVREQEALLMVARAQKEAARALERGDVAVTRRHLAESRGLLAMFSSPEAASEMAALDQMAAMLDAGNIHGTTKVGKFRAWKRRHSKGDA